MNFYAPPFDCKVEFLLQFFDDTLADIAEGSDVVRKNLDADRHSNILIRRNRAPLQLLIKNATLDTIADYGKHVLF